MEFYKTNASEFSKTRFSIWKSVKEFGQLFSTNSIVLDAGCGNGKNMEYFHHKTNIIGFDNCQEFIDICLSKHLNVTYDDIINIQYNDDRFDFIICIAVIHHLRTKIERIHAVNELLRVLKKGGKILITVWALESDEYSQKRNFHRGDNNVLFLGNDRYYFIHDKEMFTDFCNHFEVSSRNIFWDSGNWNVIFEK